MKTPRRCYSSHTFLSSPTSSTQCSASNFKVKSDNLSTLLCLNTNRRKRHSDVSLLKEMKSKESTEWSNILLTNLFIFMTQVHHINILILNVIQLAEAYFDLLGL